MSQVDLLIFLRNHQDNWSKCHSNREQISENPSLNQLIDSRFKGVKTLYSQFKNHRQEKVKSGTPEQPNLRPNYLRT